MAGRRNGVTRVRHLLVGLATISASVVASVVGGGAGVSATSCAPVSGYSWETIADGTAMFDAEGLQDPTPFFDVYESVVIGEVVSIDGDADVAPQSDTVGRQPAVDLVGLRAVTDHHTRLDQDQHTERGEHLHEGAGPLALQRTHDDPVGERPEESGECDTEGRSQQERESMLVLEFPLQVHTGDGGRSEREVQHPGSAEDDDESLRREGVQRSDTEP